MKPVRTMLKAVFLGLGAFLVWFLLPNLLALTAVLIFPEKQAAILEFAGFFGTALSTLAVMGLFALCKRPFRETVRWYPRRSTPAAHLGAVAFGVCANTAVSTLLALLPLPESLLKDYAQQSQSIYEPSHALLSLFAAVILAPVFEEILFRGYVYRFLREGLPFWAAAGGAAALFGLAHGQLLWICYAAVLGFLFCAVTERSGTLTLSVAAHLGFNLTAVPELLWPDREVSPLFLAACGIAGAVLAVILWKTVLFRKGRAA